MRTAIVMSLALAMSLAACGGGEDMGHIPGALVAVSTSVDVDDIRPSQVVPLVIDVENLYLIEPTSTPPPDHAHDAGYLELYLDDEASPPLFIAAQTHVSVTIPASITAGPHRIICRLHEHDGTPTDTTFEVDMIVQLD
jgi:hypothetical protein